MRIYHIFSMKKEFYTLYKETPELLYQILRQIYYMRECDLDYAFGLYNQLTTRINKHLIDRDLFINWHKKMSYSKSKEQHIINDLYQDEVSILVVKNSHILLTSNHSKSSFFSYLEKNNERYFVCDFTCNDYFWMSKLKTLARS